MYLRNKLSWLWEGTQNLPVSRHFYTYPALIVISCGTQSQLCSCKCLVQCITCLAYMSTFVYQCSQKTHCLNKNLQSQSNQQTDCFESCFISCRRGWGLGIKIFGIPWLPYVAKAFGLHFNPAHWNFSKLFPWLKMSVSKLVWGKTVPLQFRERLSLKLTQVLRYMPRFVLQAGKSCLTRCSRHSESDSNPHKV